MNKQLILYFLIFTCLFISGCRSKAKQPILLADREAPLGWIYLKLYDDRSFEFISRGLREETVYPGTYQISNDSLFFAYRDSVPAAGKTAIITNKTVSYINGRYPESVAIKLNQLKK